MALSETIIVRVLLAERAKLLAYIWVIVRDAHVVEDVFQETFLQLFVSRDTFDVSRPLRPWLHTAHGRDRYKDGAASASDRRKRLTREMRSTGRPFTWVQQIPVRANTQSGFGPKIPTPN